MITTLSDASILRATSATSVSLAVISLRGFKVPRLEALPSAFAEITSCGRVRCATPGPA
jgi:hypothetical protein